MCVAGGADEHLKRSCNGKQGQGGDRPSPGNSALHIVRPKLDIDDPISILLVSCQENMRSKSFRDVEIDSYMSESSGNIPSVVSKQTDITF